MPVVDMIEDIMQQSLPGFIEAIKISDIGQGTNPFRIISMSVLSLLHPLFISTHASFYSPNRRALPDQPNDHAYPRDAWMNGGEGEKTDVPSAGDMDGPMIENKAEEGMGVDGEKKEEAVGDYVVRLPGSTESLELWLTIDFDGLVWGFCRIMRSRLRISQGRDRGRR